MTRVIFSTSKMSEWIDVAKQLALEDNWYPVYWVSRPDFSQEVASAFPETTFHNVYNAIKGVPAQGFEHIADTAAVDA